MIDFLNHAVIQKIINTALKAGDLIMDFYSQPLSVQIKSDNSPVTIADIEANNFIVQALNHITPDILVISEEDETPIHINEKIFWLVDPIDGTKSFINKTGQFTVNIALVHNKYPIFGVIYAPLSQTLYFNKHNIAYKQHNNSTIPISVNNNWDEVVAIISAHHRNRQINSYLNTLKLKSVMTASSSIKFCLIAEGKADIYPNFGKTMEWDTAAGHAILNAAGGSVKTHDNKPLMYGKEKFVNDLFIAYGKNI
ncbi:3'(2'),5'-bisphosphate nucleotidase CysQ [Rickettsiales bacterium Ac37b]|nr:3'(2'),5'-bisphosphate nucleotidase CysQ [Rickettsiales bacterium Ac37b]